LLAGMSAAEAQLHLRLILAPGIPFGPGKAALLASIRDSGSIAAAGRRMDMSYQRAWDLVAAMNGQFREPLVVAVKGGPRGGGSALTPLGRQVLDAYDEIIALAAAATAERVGWLRGVLATPLEGAAGGGT
jgi:molybdate transport system regulatory protein